MGMAQFALVTAAIGAIGSCGTDDTVLDTAGPTVDRTIEVSEFDELAVAGPFKVMVADGAPGAIELSGPENVLDNMEVEVEDGELVIKMKKGVRTKWSWDDDSAVTVMMSHNALRGAEIAGSGMIDIAKAAGTDFDGDIAGSGELRIRELAVSAADFSIAGSGDLMVGGSTERLDLSIAGSGEFMNPEFSAKAADISIAGSGDVEATVTETADISIAGSGDVALTGGAKCTVSKAGSGNVVCG